MKTIHSPLFYILSLLSFVLHFARVNSPGGGASSITTGFDTMWHVQDGLLLAVEFRLVVALILIGFAVCICFLVRDKVSAATARKAHLVATALGLCAALLMLWVKAAPPGFSVPESGFYLPQASNFGQWLAIVFCTLGVDFTFQRFVRLGGNTSFLQIKFALKT